MPEITAANTNALSEDAIASVYLQGRDVPCPACGYNRRDGASATCPECRHNLSIIHEDGGWKKQFSSLASRYLMMLMVLSGIKALLSCYSVYVWLNYAINGIVLPGGVVYLYLILTTIGAISYLVIFLISFRKRRGIRNGNAYTPRQLARPMLAYTLVTLILLVSNYLAALF